ncbi:hypothetical protein DTO027B5_8962 [Paecilomyces variotii]|nr:hypothetical protein DTO207G8_3463 [Paecilomyces variotii]KAJ9309426.1 hypothetical protein DTO217A2_1044 [Paecilomyces variotii]KAJ9321767.1 hypothetical protein DTO027B3_7157 [Paecilomyces variotii]KAJ9327661.1 hypothetical protein DTO027B5_8962 [Paecilomyces variotii]KAJ9382761.1 hypothetical protein DTO063F5_5600 [Paecilomyces variotii]
MPGSAFVIGAGPRIGLAVADALKQRGYQVAVGSRNPNIAEARSHGLFAVSIDVRDANSIDNAFENVGNKIGTPSIVVYNAAASFTSTEEPFTLSPDALLEDVSVNYIGAYLSLRRAISGFKTLSETSPSSQNPKVFIATGNQLPFNPIPAAVSLGAGKSALAHIIQVAAQSYVQQNYRFYFATQIEVTSNEDVNAAAHGREYIRLIDQKQQGSWDARFMA